MDQVKIGKFIAECRKKNNLTQLQLAEKLGITDRAISKWENGKTMPDSSLMLELCDILQISVNDLLNGEMISSDGYTRKVEMQLLEALQEKELVSKRLLALRPFLLVLVLSIAVLSGLIVYQIPIPGWLAFGIAIINLSITVFWSLIDVKLLQVTGYFRCCECGHIHVPSFWNCLLGAHVSYKHAHLRCPSCKKRSKHIKVFTKD